MTKDKTGGDIKQIIAEMRGKVLNESFQCEFGSIPYDVTTLDSENITAILDYVEYLQETIEHDQELLRDLDLVLNGERTNGAESLAAQIYIAKSKQSAPPRG